MSTDEYSGPTPIVFDSSLAVGAEEFVSSWNQHNQEHPARAIGESERGAIEMISDPTVTGVLIDLAVGLGGALLYDLLKAAVLRTDTQAEIKIEQKIDEWGNTYLQVSRD